MEDAITDLRNRVGRMEQNIHSSSATSDFDTSIAPTMRPADKKKSKPLRPVSPPHLLKPPAPSEGDN